MIRALPGGGRRGPHVAAERVVEADAGDARVGLRVEQREPRARQVGLGVGQRRRRAAAVVEELALHPVRLLGARELARARLDREVGLAHALPVLL